MTELDIHLCHYGCGKQAIHQFKNGKWCCSKLHNSCPALSKKYAHDTSGFKNGMFGKISPKKGKKNVYSEESLKKMSDAKKGKRAWNKDKKGCFSDDTRAKIGRASLGRKMSDENKEKQRQKMLNGKAAYMNKFIKNPSKPEVILREMVKQLYPNCEPQYKVFNYSIDIVVPEHKIAIEYDGGIILIVKRV